MNFIKGLFKSLFVSLSSFKIEALIAVVVIAVLVSWHYISLNSAIERTRYETTTKIETVYKERIRVLKVESDKVEKELRDTIIVQKKEQDDKLQVAATKYSNLLNSVQNRPERPSGRSSVSNNSGNGKGTIGATGKELYRDDSIFLGRLAADAEELKIHLQSCYKQYDTVREELEKYREGHRTP